MNDVVVRLVGGLGNQMFQYATARAVALRCDAPLLIDLSWFATVSERRFALSPFRIKAGTFAPESQRSAWRRLLLRATRRLNHSKARMFGRPLFVEKSFHFDPRVLGLNAPVYLDGYFQSEKYFLDFRQTIVDDFKLIAPPRNDTQAMLRRIESSDAICLHIRRGDYVTNSDANSYHGVCSMDYYRRGLEIVADGLATPHCFVFSDDPAWVRNNLRLDLPIILVDIHDTGEAHEDLRLMAACQRFVIANSSLSWWGAWLGRRTGKRVVAPRQWFKAGNNDTRDLIPLEWIRV